jgi:hypothetical protein
MMKEIVEAGRNPPLSSLTGRDDLKTKALEFSCFLNEHPRLFDEPQDKKTIPTAVVLSSSK